MSNLEKVKERPLIEGYEDSYVNEIRNLIDKSGNLNKEQIKLFLFIAKERGLDPRLKQVYALAHFNKKHGRYDMTTIVSIDGFRLIADRTNAYAPGRATDFIRGDKGQLLGATAYVKKLTRDGTWHEVAETAFISEYKPKGPNNFWDNMPSVMISKVAEARALRRAFPDSFAGLYSEEEMQQAKKDVQESATIQDAVIEPVDSCISADKLAQIRDCIDGSEEIEQKLCAICCISKLEEMKESQIKAAGLWVKANVKKPQLTAAV